MRRLIKVILIVLMMNVSCFSHADNYQLVIESGTNKVLDVLQQKSLRQQIAKLSLGGIVEWSALQLVGQPYIGHLLDESTSEYLYISLTTTDCMLFVEEVIAVSQLIQQHDLNLDGLTRNIKQLRYHGNIAYCNRNHYFKDWAVSNINAGVMIDEGYNLTHTVFPYSAHVLGDNIKYPDNMHFKDLSCIEAREKIIDKEQLGFIPLKKLPTYLQNIKNGDIIGIVRVSNSQEDAVHHVGIAYIHNGRIGMIHASSTFKKVVITDSLIEYLNKFKDSQGIILLRVTN